MPNARTELPDFVTPALIEATYRRAMFAQDYAMNHPHDQRCKDWMKRGVRAARDRSPRLMLMLEHGARHLQQANQDQQARFAANPEGVEYKACEFTEYSQWRAAYECADCGGTQGADHAIFAWIYGAAYEAAVRGRRAFNADFGY